MHYTSSLPFPQQMAPPQEWAPYQRITAQQLFFLSFSLTSSSFMFSLFLFLLFFFFFFPDMTGSFGYPAVGTFTRFDKMSGRSPGASLTPGSPSFRPRTQLDTSLRHRPSAPASSLLLTSPVYKQQPSSQGRTPEACICWLFYTSAENSSK